jgi:GNAT superfamily N-acetyltransferase
MAHVVMSFGETWRKVLQRSRESGPLFAAQVSLQSVIPRHLFDVPMFFLCELDLRNFAHVRERDPEIRAATPEDIDLHATVGGPSPEELHAGFERGVRVWLLEREGQPIAVMGVSPNDYERQDWGLIKASPKDIWAFGLRVLPEYRGQGIGPRMNRHVASECARLGYSRIVSSVQSLNRNSLRADQKVGYKRICHFFVFRLLGCTLVYSRGFLRLGRWNSRRRLELQIELFDKGLH